MESELSEGPEMVGSGHSVGGVISNKVGPGVPVSFYLRYCVTFRIFHIKQGLVVE